MSAESVVGQSITGMKSADALGMITALAAATGGLQQTILALAACHGGRGGPWLNELEGRLMRDAKNVVFNGVSMEAETAAVEAALANLRTVFAAVRKRLG